MVDETNKDDAPNEKQTEIADDTAMEQVKTESEPQKDEIQDEQPAAGSSDDTAMEQMKTESELQKDEIQDEQPGAGSSDDTSKVPGDSMESVMDMYEESFKRFAEGEVVTGRIISIDKDQVLIDIGYKSEGQVRVQEFLDENRIFRREWRHHGQRRRYHRSHG
jgi:hypothetical protein